MEFIGCDTLKCTGRIGALITKNEAVWKTVMKFCQARLSPPLIGQIVAEVKAETIMMAPAAGFYTTPGAGKNQVRLAYVLCKEYIQRALMILEKAIEEYDAQRKR